MLDVITAPRKGTAHRLQKVSWQKGVNLTKSTTETTTFKKTEWSCTELRVCNTITPETCELDKGVSRHKSYSSPVTVMSHYAHTRLQHRLADATKQQTTDRGRGLREIVGGLEMQHIEMQTPRQHIKPYKHHVLPNMRNSYLACTHCLSSTSAKCCQVLHMSSCKYAIVP